MEALSAGLDGRLLALTRRTPSGGDWLLTLQSSLGGDDRDKLAPVARAH
jgi:hypothetical protein